MSFDTLKSEVVYRGRVFDVRRDHVLLPGGRTSNLDVVVHTGAVTLVPVDEDGNIWFVRQYRHPIQKELIELPAGTLEPDEPVEVCAQRELREEIGMSAGEFLQIGTFYLAPGYSTEMMHVFLARKLSPDPLPRDEDELLSVEQFPISRVYKMVEQGAIEDAKSIAALFLCRTYLENSF